MLPVGRWSNVADIVSDLFAVSSLDIVNPVGEFGNPSSVFKQLIFQLGISNVKSLF